MWKLTSPLGYKKSFKSWVGYLSSSKPWSMVISKAQSKPQSLMYPSSLYSHD